MSNKEPYNPFQMFTESMKNFAGDRDSMIANHKKNIEALTEANKMAVEVMRNITQLQQQYIKQAFDSISGMMKDVMQNGMNQESWKKHTDQLKKHMNESIDHGVKVTTVLTKSQKDIYENMKARASEHLDEIKKASTKTKH